MDVEHELVQVSATSKLDTHKVGVSQLSADISRDGDAYALARLGKKQVLKVCLMTSQPRPHPVNDEHLC